MRLKEANPLLETSRLKFKLDLGHQSMTIAVQEPPLGIPQDIPHDRDFDWTLARAHNTIRAELIS